MVGRKAYHEPYHMATWDRDYFGSSAAIPSRQEVELQMLAYMQREAAAHGTPWYPIARHMLGLYHGQRGARLWRQVWSDHRLKNEPAAAVYTQAQAALLQ